jgi:hypothetical protein
MGLRPTQGDEQRPLSSNHFHESFTLPFVIPSAAEGSAVPRTSPGNAESYSATNLSSRPEHSVVERSAVSFCCVVYEFIVSFL